ncbi:MAG TPA: TonB family protein [Bryobacteraceae bacterium]
MRFGVLFTVLAGIAWGQLHPQVDPEAEALFRRATTAFQQLPAYELDVETTGSGFHILATVAVRQPDRILISGSTPATGQTTVFSDGRTSLFWEESSNLYARIDAAIPAATLLHLTDLTPEAEPTAQNLTSAKILRDDTIYIDGERFDCKVVRIETAGPHERTLWVDTKTGVALRQQTFVTPPGLKTEIPATSNVTRFHHGARAADAGDFSFIVPADATEVDWRQMDLEVTHRGLIGELPPPLRLTTVDGRPVDLAKLRGKPVLLHFEAPWCKPCEDAAPALESVAKTMGNDVRILRINDGNAEALGIKAWPANMLIGREGKILTFDAGRASEAALLALLRNAASPQPAQPPRIWGATEKHRGEVAPPELVYKVDPGYTLGAQKAKVSGTVMLAILIGTDGHVSDIHVLEKLDPGLDARAITAVSKWRFKPAMHGDTPVAFRARAGVSFMER